MFRVEYYDGKQNKKREEKEVNVEIWVKQIHFQLQTAASCLEWLPNYKSAMLAFQFKLNAFDIDVFVGKRRGEFIIKQFNENVSVLSREIFEFERN